MECPNCHEFLSLDKEKQVFLFGPKNLFGLLVTVIVVPVLIYLGVPKWPAIGVSVVIIFFVVAGKRYYFCNGCDKKYVYKWKTLYGR